MTKTYRITNLDCACCAQKIEDALRKVDGVRDVRVSFLTQKLVLTAEQEQFDEVVEAAMKVCRKVEPDCRILI